MNENMPAALKGISAALGSFFGFIFGGMNGLFTALLVLMIVDYITGVIVAVYKRELSSKVGFRGILKKLMMLCILCMAHIVDIYVLAIAIDGVVGAPLMTLCEFLFIANEGISILENAGALGIKLPAKVLETLKQLKKKSEGFDDGKSVIDTGDDNSDES